jgi:hypothetical protein
MYMLRLSGSYEVEVTRRGTSNSPWTRKYSSASRGQEYRCSWLRHEHGDIEVCVHRYQTPLPVPITWSQELSALSGVLDGSKSAFCAAYHKPRAFGMCKSTWSAPVCACESLWKGFPGGTLIWRSAVSVWLYRSLSVRSAQAQKRG